MNMKLTGLRDLLKAPSDPRGFGHNFISKKIRLMRKKCSVTQKWQNILPIPKLENVEKMHWAHVLDTLSGYLNTLHKLILGANIASKTFEMALKSKIHFQKSKKKSEYSTHSRT